MANSVPTKQAGFCNPKLISILNSTQMMGAKVFPSTDTNITNCTSGLGIEHIQYNLNTTNCIVILFCYPFESDRDLKFSNIRLIDEPRNEQNRINMHVWDLEVL